MSATHSKSSPPARSIPVPSVAQRLDTITTNLHLLEGQLALLERADREGELSVMAGRPIYVEIAHQMLGDMHMELSWLENVPSLTTIDAPDEDQRDERKAVRS